MMYYKILFEAVPHSLNNRDDYTNENLTMKAKSNRNNIYTTSNVKGNFNIKCSRSVEFNEFHSITLNFSKSTKTSSCIAKCNATTHEGSFFICVI